MQKPLLLFDFDGVIADTFHITHKIAQRMCVFMTDTEYRKKFEDNIYRADDAIRNGPDHGDRCDHMLDWMGAYMPEFNTHARAFDGMPELLMRFSEHFELLIVSSTHDDLISDFLRKYGLHDAVGSVYPMELSTRKDEKFKMIFAKYDIKPNATVFITDTLGDINEASSVGLKSIGVTWGFQDRHTLERGNPFRIVDTPQELPESVADYFKRA